MKPRVTVWLVIMGMALAVGASAQTPRVVRHSGVVRDGAGQPRAGAATLTFAIYAEAEGGAPLWTEVQAVTLDSQGRYAVALGALAPEGLPLELFTSGEARWLGVAVDGEVELPRVALLSVPYALKAADTETIGGKPLSAFVLAGDTTGTGADGLTYVNKRVLSQAVSGTLAPIAASFGAPGYIGVFTNSTDLGNSIMFQSGSSIGVNTTAPLAAFHTMATAAPGAFFDVYNNSLGALPVVYRAARGTPGAPTAVQTDDILGGLAVRGYGTTGFSGGQGQVMFRAAENWTDAAHGTYLQFTTTPLGSASWTERMRITPDGRVTIGTTASGFYPTLRVVGAATAAGGDGVYGESISTGGYGVFGQSTGDNGVGVYGYAPGTGGTAVTAFSSSGLALAASSGAGAASTMAYFSGAGRVGIGTTSAQDKLDVRGDVRLGTGATGCLKDADGTVLTGVCVSDRRFKSGVTPFARSLEAVTQLQPVHFNWRATEFPDRHFGNTRSFGLIAQEVEAVLPELVTTDEAGFKAVRYNALPFHMLQAIKELKTENDALKAENTTLRQQGADLDARLRALEQALEQLREELHRGGTHGRVAGGSLR